MSYTTNKKINNIHDVINLSGDLAYDWHVQKDEIVWFGKTQDFFQYDGVDDIIASGEKFKSFIHPKDLIIRDKALTYHQATGEVYDCEYPVEFEKGKITWVHDRGQADFLENGQISHIRGILRRINHRKEYETLLEHLVNFDELTGHYNRKRLRDALDEALIRTQRYKTTGGYLTISIDNLSNIKDNFQNSAADSVIMAVGGKLETVLRSSDLIGRVASDQFGVVLARCEPDSLPIVSEKILNLFRGKVLETDDGSFKISISIGCIVFPAYAHTASHIMSLAEHALQKAIQENNRNNFHQYEWSDDQKRLHDVNKDISDQVMLALKSGRILFAFQPVVMAKTQRIAFYEALLRIRDLDGSLIPAAVFIEAVEQSGLTRVIDQYVLTKAVEKLRQNQDIILALNISALTVQDRAWLRRLVNLLRQKPKIARRMIIEITETAAIHDMEESELFIQTIRNLGCQVAIDDFGSGYTSFKHLQSLTIDIVKIDGSFAKDIVKNKEHQEFVRTLMQTAKQLDMTIVAEAIETEEEAKFFTDQGITFLQGYYFGRPKTEIPVPKKRKTKKNTTPDHLADDEKTDTVR